MRRDRILQPEWPGELNFEAMKTAPNQAGRKKDCHLRLGSSDIKSNLTTYIDSFSKDAREIFEHFKFADRVGQLEDANLLYKVVQKVTQTDLSPAAISDHEFGYRRITTERTLRLSVQFVDASIETLRFAKEN